MVSRHEDLETYKGMLLSSIEKRCRQERSDTSDILHQAKMTAEQIRGDTLLLRANSIQTQNNNNLNKRYEEYATMTALSQAIDGTLIDGRDETQLSKCP